MLDHMSLSVPSKDFPAHVSFYLAALKPIGYTKIMEFPGAVGLGQAEVKGQSAHGPPDFWLVAKEEGENDLQLQGKGDVHVAFAAKDRTVVDSFHSAAVDAGGACNGQPGVREMYHKNYYAAFVRDLMGNNVEAVYHGID